MASLFARRRHLAWTMISLATLLVILRWELQSSSTASGLATSATPMRPAVVATAILPDYVIDGGMSAHAATVQRTLFNPTRRPAPAVPNEPAESQLLKKGQFLLVGSTVTNDRRVAFLREIASGKSRMVRQGDQVNGITVAEVSADTVRLQRGSQSEELRLAAPGAAKTGSAPASVPVVPPSQGAPAGNAYLRGAPVPTPTPTDPPSEGQPPSQD